MLQPFHLAIPVHDLQATRAFYQDLLGCTLGRTSSQWIDINFFGHQLVLHLVPQENKTLLPCNVVDKKHVPVPHFGVVLSWKDWHDLSNKLTQHGIYFIIEPYIRFPNEIGEQATMFFSDPSGNMLEFKAFRDIGRLFAV